MKQPSRPGWGLSRLAAVGLILGISLLYFPINRMVSGGVGGIRPISAKTTGRIYDQFQPLQRVRRLAPG